jgi:hypothetical protein
MTTCPSCGIAGNNFNCPNHITRWGINPLPDSIPMPEQSAWASLYAEIGRLNVLLNERDKEIEWLRGERPAVVAWLFRNHYDDTAERIERGEHRRGEGKE